MIDVTFNIDGLFGAFGGPTSVAAILGVRQSTASEMKRRKSIPVRYWPTLIEAARDRQIEGLSYEALVAAHTSKTEAAA